MAMLNFKYGLHQNLPAYDETKLGTIYVTSDEHAMYIDLPKDATYNPNGRIRLSQIISIPTVTEWENMEPPYSTEAFYYIVEANALIKYNGIVDGKHDWKQINSTAALSAALSALEVRVKAIEDQNYSTKITAINTAIEALQGEDRTLAKGISDNAAAHSALVERVNSLDKMLSFQGVVTALPASATINDTCIYGGEIYIYHEKEDGSTGWEVYADVVQQIEDLKEELATMATSTTVTALTTRVGNLETWKGTAQPAIEEADRKGAQGIADAATAQAAAEAAQKAADDAAELGQKGIDDAADAATAAGAAKTLAQQGVDDAEAARALAASKVTMAEVEAKDYATKDQAQGYANAVKGSEGDAATANTVYGAKAAASAAHQAANDAATAAAAAKAQADKGVEDAAAAMAEAQAKTTMAAVEAKNYATKTEAQDMANEVLGDAQDTASDNTVFGAKAAAAAASTAAAAAKTQADKGVEDAAAAQQRADDAYTLAGQAKAAAEERVLKTEFETFKETNDDAIADAKKAGTDAATAATGAMTRANEAYSLAETKVTMAQVEAKNYATVSYVDGEVAELLGTASDEATKNTVYGAKAAAAAAQAKADSNATAITGVDTKVNKEIEDREKAITDLRNEVVADMQTADAMVFIDTVASADDLPSVGDQVNGKTLSNGWTYKATNEFILGDTPVYVGDLLIASGAEDATTGALTSLEWKHVPSGYVADYNPQMDVVSGGTNVVRIKLTSGALKTDDDATNDTDGDLGNVGLKADADSAIVISAVADDITIGMAWGEF